MTPEVNGKVGKILLLVGFLLIVIGLIVFIAGILLGAIQTSSGIIFLISFVGCGCFLGFLGYLLVKGKWVEPDLEAYPKI